MCMYAPPHFYDCVSWFLSVWHRHSWDAANSRGSPSRTASRVPTTSDRDISSLTLLADLVSEYRVCTVHLRVAAECFPRYIFNSRSFWAWRASGGVLIQWRMSRWYGREKNRNAETETAQRPFWVKAVGKVGGTEGTGETAENENATDRICDDDSQFRSRKWHAT